MNNDTDSITPLEGVKLTVVYDNNSSDIKDEDFIKWIFTEKTL